MFDFCYDVVVRGAEGGGGGGHLLSCKNDSLLVEHV